MLFDVAGLTVTDQGDICSARRNKQIKGAVAWLRI